MWTIIHLAMALSCSAELAAGTAGRQESRRIDAPQEAWNEGKPAPRGESSQVSEISGRVTYRESGRPVRRATVVASSAQSTDVGVVSTGRDGAFRISSLKPGLYTVRAQGYGLIAGQGDVAARGGVTKTVSLGKGQKVADVDALSRGAVVVGRVLDEDGEPLPGAVVSALQYHTIAGARRLVPVREPSRTDDTGGFRLFGLPPGKTVIKAVFTSPMGDEALTPRQTPSTCPSTTQARPTPPMRSSWICSSARRSSLTSRSRQ
jgi:hypothetical protein